MPTNITSVDTSRQRFGDYKEKMISSPLDAHPLPGTSRFLTSERISCLPPPYDAQQTPPPYPSCSSKTVVRRPTTRSFPFGAGVTFEWTHGIPPSPDDIILAMVRINPLGRRQSFDDPLPERYAVWLSKNERSRRILIQEQSTATRPFPSYQLQGFQQR